MTKRTPINEIYLPDLGFEKLIRNTYRIKVRERTYLRCMFDRCNLQMSLDTYDSSGLVCIASVELIPISYFHELQGLYYRLSGKKLTK